MKTWHNITDSILTKIETLQEKAYNLTQTNNTQILLNRYGFTRVSTHLTLRTQWNVEKLNSESIISFERYEYDYFHQGKKRTVDPGDVDICFHGGCVNCKLLEQTIDDFVDAICGCINDAEKGIIYDIDDFMASYNTTYVYSNNSVSISLPQNPSSSTKQETGFVGFIIRTSDTLIGLFLPGWPGTRNIIQNAKDFFLNDDLDDRNGLIFWLKFVSPFGCNYKTMSRCENSYRTRPLWDMIKLVLWIVIIISIATFIGFPLLTPLLITVLTVSLYIVFAGTYGMAPACMIPTPTPILPNCLADDIFALSKSFDYDCIPWDEFLPGITSPQCVSTENNYQKQFVDCGASPYRFTDGFRHIFFYFEWKYPGVNDFIRDNNSPLIHWIYETEFFRDKMEFDFGINQTRPNDTWISCHKEMLAFNFLPASVATYELLLDTSYFIYPIYLVLVLIMTTGTLCIVLVIHVCLYCTGVRYKRSSYFKNESELPTQQPTPSDAYPGRIVTSKKDK
jgi:hypothetical protein